VADNNGRTFWHIDIVGALEVLALVGAIVGGYTELKVHEKMTRDGLESVAKEAKEFHNKMEDFAKRQDNRAVRQDQVDRDCPPHWHGKKGEIHYCRQREPTFADGTPSEDPSADAVSIPEPKQK